LQETIAKVRQATALRRMYQMLSEESPLDMAKLFGGSAGALSPDPWLYDNLDTVERLLRLVREGSLQINRGGRMSLFALLKWINSLSDRGGRAGGEATKDNDLIELAFPGNQLASISERAWLELLMRSRKRFLLSYRVAAAQSGGSRPQRCCECRSAARRRHCVPCTDGRGITRGQREQLCRASRALRRTEATAPELPPFSDAELKPRLAVLAVSDRAPSEKIDDQYNRALFDNEVLPLVRELKRALADSKVLVPDEKLRLSKLVRGEIGSYARRYCAALEQFHLSFHFHPGDGSTADLHTALLDLTRPGSRFVSHLFAVADNASLHGLDDPYLSPLAQCLAEFQPIVRVMYGEAGPPSAGKADGGGSDGKSSRPLKPQELEKYLEVIAKQAEELDRIGPSEASKSSPAGKSSPGGGPSSSASGLEEQLGALGRNALAVLQGRDRAPYKQAEAFLDKAGIIGSLRRPFLAPFDVAYRRGVHDIERAVARHWQNETLSPIAQLLSRFPFNQGAEREVAPSELDLLNEAGGAFWQDVRGFYAPVLSEQSGTYRARGESSRAIALPKDMLATLNQLAKLSRVLFDSAGKRQPLRFTVRSVPGGITAPEKSTQPAAAFLQVGKLSVYGFNQRVTAEALSVDWWSQGPALVGHERTAARSGRRHTETLEVSDSAWSLFRLLQKTTLDSEGVSTWRIHSDAGQEETLIRFVLSPDPWAPFRIRLP
jgi:hypothetical protein